MLGQPLVESFNFMLNGGLKKAINDISPIEFEMVCGDKVKIKLTSAHIMKPEVSSNINPPPKDTKVYPRECRMRGGSYKGNLTVQFGWSLNGVTQMPLERSCGNIPIMVSFLFHDYFSVLLIHYL